MASTASLTASKLFNFTNKVAVVTGGGTGIGLMAAQALAANGAKVYIIGRRLEALQQAVKAHGSKEALGNAGGSLIPLQGDVNEKEGIAKFVEEISKKESAVHVLVNNAGIAGPTRSTEKGDESAEAMSKELGQDTFDDWLNVYRTNVVGVYFTATLMLPLLAAATKEHPGYSASIINITSISGITSNAQHHMPYNTSKGAAIHLTNLMSKEFAREGVKVRVNSVAPGIFPSEMTTDGSGENQKSHIDAAGYRSEKGIPAGRPGKDEDMAQAILSMAANQYLNGQTVAIDGGYLLTNPS